jgi:hypothetical protein
MTMNGFSGMSNEHLDERRRQIRAKHPREWSSHERRELFSMKIEIEGRLAATGDPRFQQCETCASLPRAPGSRWCQPCVEGTRWK